MRTGFLAALTVVVAGNGLAFAQENGNPSFLPGNVWVPTNSFGFWGAGEYLLWRTKNGRIPPLATTGGNGKIGSPGTQVLVDSLDFVSDPVSGGRFLLGYRFETMPCIGIEANYF